MRSNPNSSEAPGDHVVLFSRDTGLATDDEVALVQRPLVPAVERRLKAAAERPSYRFHLRAREYRAMNRDQLPPCEPLGQRGRRSAQLARRMPSAR